MNSVDSWGRGVRIDRRWISLRGARYVRAHVVSLRLIQLPAFMLRVLWILRAQVDPHDLSWPGLVRVAELGRQLSWCVRGHERGRFEWFRAGFRGLVSDFEFVRHTSPMSEPQAGHG